MTKRTGILIAVIAALVAGGLAIGLGLMSNSHATEPTTAAHTAATTTTTTTTDDGASGPTVDYRPADYRAAPTAPTAPTAPATTAADNGPPSGGTAGSCQRYCSGQWRRS